MLDIESLICFQFCPAVFTLFFLVGAIQHIYSLGKSKSRIRKEMSATVLWKKVMLIGLVEKSQYHTCLAKKLCYIYWGYLLFLVLSIITLAISLAGLSTKRLLIYLVVTKLFLFDIPLNLYFFCMTKFDSKHGGITYVWSKNE